MQYAPLTGLPSTHIFANRSQQLSKQITILGLLIAIMCGFSFVMLGLDSPILPMALLLCLAVPILIWNNTSLVLYFVFAGTCLFEIFQTPYSDALTDRVPFFWNVNTIFQTYAHVNFKGVPLNLVEVLFVLAGVTSMVRAVVMNNVKIKYGPLIVPIAVYIGFVIWGWVNGLATGGDSKMALQEIRPQFYLLVSYLIGVNMVRERKHIDRMLWIMALTIGLKGILYTFRRNVTLAGMPMPDQGVGSHEEAFLFDAFMTLLLILRVCDTKKALSWVMITLSPMVVLGNLATNRRAATAAMIILVPALLMCAYRAFPQKRRFIAIFSIALVVLGNIYYQAFKNSEAMIAQPARAVRSQFQPDERDALSNAYRDAENADQMATIRSAPIQGYGYGKHFFHVVPIADISSEYEWWDVLPHNQILWVWMRVGTFGFIAFWFMVCSIIMHFCRMICNEALDPDIKAVAIFVIVTTAMLMIFGLLDLQISNPRDMLFTGFWIGAVALADTLPPDVTPTKKRLSWRM